MFSRPFGQVVQSSARHKVRRRRANAKGEHIPWRSTDLPQSCLMITLRSLSRPERRPSPFVLRGHESQMAERSKTSEHFGNVYPCAIHRIRRAVQLHHTVYGTGSPACPSAAIPPTSQLRRRRCRRWCRRQHPKSPAATRRSKSSASIQAPMPSTDDMVAGKMPRSSTDSSLRPVRFFLSSLFTGIPSSRHVLMPC